MEKPREPPKIEHELAIAHQQPQGVRRQTEHRQVSRSARGRHKMSLAHVLEPLGRPPLRGSPTKEELGKKITEEQKLERGQHQERAKCQTRFADAGIGLAAERIATELTLELSPF
jgi:hypothetical protein